RSRPIWSGGPGIAPARFPCRTWSPMNSPRTWNVRVWKPSARGASTGSELVAPAAPPRATRAPSSSRTDPCAPLVGCFALREVLLGQLARRGARPGPPWWPGGSGLAALDFLRLIAAGHPLGRAAGGEGTGERDHGPAHGCKDHQLTDADFAVVLTGGWGMTGDGLPPDGQCLIGRETGGHRGHRGDQLLQVHVPLLGSNPSAPHPTDSPELSTRARAGVPLTVTRQGSAPGR